MSDAKFIHEYDVRQACTRAPCVERYVEVLRLRTALERIAKGKRSNGRLMSWGDFTFEAEAALHPPNSRPLEQHTTKAGGVQDHGPHPDGLGSQSGDLTLEGAKPLHPTDNSSPAAAPPPPDPTCPQCGGPEHDRQGRPLNPAPAASPEKGTGRTCPDGWACGQLCGTGTCRRAGPSVLMSDGTTERVDLTRPLAPLNPPCGTCGHSTFEHAAGYCQMCPCRTTPEALDDLR